MTDIVFDHNLSRFTNNVFRYVFFYNNASLVGQMLFLRCQYKEEKDFVRVLVNDDKMPVVSKVKASNATGCNETNCILETVGSALLNEKNKIQVDYYHFNEKSYLALEHSFDGVTWALFDWTKTLGCTQFYELSLSFVVN